MKMKHFAKYWPADLQKDVKDNLKELVSCIALCAHWSTILIVSKNSSKLATNKFTAHLAVYQLLQKIPFI
jgi:hypothetical protein